MDTTSLEVSLEKMYLASPYTAAVNGHSLENNVNDTASSSNASPPLPEVLTAIDATPRSPTHISSLPAEVLAFIFQLMVCFTFTDSVGPTASGFAYFVQTQLPMLFTITNVCRKWRSTAFSTGTLWSTIAVDPTWVRAPLMVQRFLELSKEAPLVICVDQYHSTLSGPPQIGIYDQCIALIQAHTHRVRVLATLGFTSLIIDCPEWRLTHLELFRSNATSSRSGSGVLQLLVLPNLHQFGEFSENAIDDLMGLLLPLRIRHLQLHTLGYIVCNRYFYLPFWSTLVRLKVSVGSSAFDCIKHIVEHCQALQFLSLQHLWDPINPDTALDSASALLLPQLRQLELGGCVSAAHRLLHKLEFPALEELRLHLTSSGCAGPNCPLPETPELMDTLGKNVGRVIVGQFVHADLTLKTIYLSDDERSGIPFDAFGVLKVGLRNKHLPHSVTVWLRSYGSSSEKNGTAHPTHGQDDMYGDGMWHPFHI